MRENRQMKERPLSIAVIGWILIAAGILSFISTLVNLNNPLVRELMSKSLIPMQAQFAMLIIGLAVTVVSGAAILGGRNWGRWLYIVWSVVGMIVGLATSPIDGCS